MATHAPPDNLPTFPIVKGRRYISNHWCLAIRVLSVNTTTEQCRIESRLSFMQWLSMGDIRRDWHPDPADDPSFARGSRIAMEAAFLRAHDAKRGITRSDADVLRLAEFAAEFTRGPDGALSDADAALLRSARGTPTT